MSAGSTSKSDPWPVFFYEGMAVGYFEEDAPLTLPSTRRYMPCRGAGHYEMVQVLKAGGRPRCSCMLGDALVEFLVLDSPAYGTIALGHLDGDRGEE